MTISPARITSPSQKRIRSNPVFLHVVNPALVEDTFAFERLRTHVTQLKVMDLPEIMQPRSVRAYSDYVSIVMEKPKGSDLMSILRAERVVHLVEAAPLLESIADVCDRLASEELPGAQLAAAHIYVEWPDDENKSGSQERQLSKARPKLYPRFLAVSEAPELARLNEPEDASSTMTTDMLGDPSRADNVCEHFGTLLYRIVAGRNCPIAASLSSQAYIPVPGLSEQANRTLSLVIAKQIAVASCGQVLREILGAEGIVPRSPGHPSAGFTARGTGSTVVPPGATPPLPLRTPAKTSTASTASSSRFRPMPVAPPAAGPPPPLVVPPPKAAPPPLVVPVPPVVFPPPRPIEPVTSVPAVSAPLAPETKSVAATDVPAVEAKKTPAAEPLKPPTPVREPTPKPSVTTPEPDPTASIPISKLPTEGEIKDKVPIPTPAAKTSARKSRQIAAKTPAAEIAAKEEKARTEPEVKSAPAVKPAPVVKPEPAIEPEPVIKAAPSPLEAVTVVNEKIVAPATPISRPRMTVPTAPPIPQPNIIQSAIPWFRSNVRPIGIGIAALLVASVAYGVIQKVRSRPATDKTPATTSVTKQREEPALMPAKNIVPPPAPEPSAAIAGPNTDQDKIDAEKLRVERASQEQKSADEAKLAAQKAADEAKLSAERLAEQQKVERHDETKIAPAPDAAANAKTADAPKTRVTQKQTQKDPQPSRSSNRTSTTSQSTNRPAPVTRTAPAPKPTNSSQHPKSEFGPSAPGG